MSSTSESPMLTRLVITIAVIIGGIFMVRYLMINGRAPSAEYRLLNGNVVSTADFKGQVLVLNFWATNCGPCLQEMPDLVKAHQQYRSQGVEVMAVALSYDNLEKVISYTHNNAIPFKMAFDSTGAVSNSWGDIRRTPTTFIIDRNGRVAQEFVGTINPARLNQAIEKLL